MIAAGWDTARNVAIGVATLWIIVFGAFCALGCLYDYRQRQHRADNELRALLQADVDMEIDTFRQIIDRLPPMTWGDQIQDDISKRQPTLDETEVDTWITQIHTADPADIQIHAVTDRRLLRRPQ